MVYLSRASPTFWLAWWWFFIITQCQLVLNFSWENFCRIVNLLSWLLVDTDYRLISKSPLLSCAFILQWMPLAEFVAQPLIQEDGMFKKIIDICIARLGKHYCGLLPHQVVSKFDGRLSCLYYNVIDAQDVNCRGNWSHPSTISQSQHPSPVVSWNASGVSPLEERDGSNNSASIRGLTS